MRYLQIYEKFGTDSETLYIFDFDDTLVDTPNFEEEVIKLLKESVTVKSLLKRSVGMIGKSMSDLKWEHGRIYVSDPDSEIEVKGNWVRKKQRVYLMVPDKFYYTELSLPKKALPLGEFYNSVENKAIVTGRIRDMKPKIEKNLDSLGLDQPSHGLFCYPSRDEISDRVAEWKAKTIVRLIKKSGFKKVKFYEDRSKWLRTVKNAVEKKLPYVEFEGIKC
jgi:hypothetical protein